MVTGLKRCVPLFPPRRVPLPLHASALGLRRPSHSGRGAAIGFPRHLGPCHACEGIGGRGDVSFDFIGCNLTEAGQLLQALKLLAQLRIVRLQLAALLFQGSLTSLTCRPCSTRITDREAFSARRRHTYLSPTWH
eukprot:scaffold100934_cov34-Tisochrysis_lutea.AAC.3